jgi:hypothetical protein
MTEIDDAIRDLLRPSGPPGTMLPSLAPEQLRLARPTRGYSRVGLVVGAALFVGMGAWQFMARQDQPNVVGSGPDASPVLRHTPMEPQLMAEIASEVSVERGSNCLTLNGRPLVWPENAVWNDELEQVNFTQGERQFTASVNKTFPQDVSGGLVPIRLASRFLDQDTIHRIESCATGNYDDVLVIN